MPIPLVEYYIDELELMDQLDTVQEFYEQVCKLKELILKSDPTYTEKYFVACFVQGLSPIIAEFVSSRAPHTLPFAYKCALCKERELNSTDSVSDGHDDADVIIPIVFSNENTTTYVILTDADVPKLESPVTTAYSTSMVP